MRIARRRTHSGRTRSSRRTSSAAQSTTTASCPFCSSQIEALWVSERGGQSKVAGCPPPSRYGQLSLAEPLRSLAPYGSLRWPGLLQEVSRLSGAVRSPTRRPDPPSHPRLLSPHALRVQPASTMLAGDLSVASTSPLLAQDEPYVDCCSSPFTHRSSSSPSLTAWPPFDHCARRRCELRVGPGRLKRC